MLAEKNFYPDSGMTIGLDIGGTNIKGVLLSGKKVIARKKIFTKSKSNKKIILTRIFGCIDYLLSKEKKVDKIAIGVAGPIDFKKKKVLNPPNVIGLKNTYLAKIVEDRFKIKTILDNDVNCLVLTEAVLGAGKSRRLVVGLGLGTGLGGGIVLNKKIFHGINGTAGEIGHMIIQYNGRQCHCGNKGCLEVYVNEKGIRKTAKEIFGKEIDTISLYEMAKRGNKKAIKVWQITGQYLGIGSANLVNILNPDIIVIGGGIAGAGEFLLSPARKEMKKNILSPLAKNTKVVRAQLGEYAGAIGAGLLG
jgi:glucokinase